MRTKFICLDGFKEIEPIQGMTRKPKRKPRTSSKPTRLERYYAERRREGSEQIAKSAVTATRLYRLRRKAAGGASAFIRKKSALGLAAALVVAVLCTTAVNMPSSAAETKTVTVKNTAREGKANAVAKANPVDSVRVEPAAVYGYGLFIDGELVGVCIDDGELEAALQQKLDDYKAKYDEETTDEFANSVEVVYGSYSDIDIQSADDIVNENADRLSYSLSTDIEYTQETPYETITEYDDDEYTDYSETKQSGKNGEEKVIYRITYVDGVQTDSELKDVTTVSEPRDEIVVVGTKERPSQGYASGSFIWPVPYTSTITSTYGERWGAFHSGLDISDGGVYGQDIVASDGGTVEWAGYDDSGYGNYVIINHNNGYLTLYGHCSEVYVSAGQSVAQGEAIAAVGSTGDSTGPHLHFEVRTSGGERLDPQGFV